MGISRSASLVIAYLMRRYKYGYEKAYNKVKDRRKIINPNPGFVMQLKKYDGKIK
jgi:protein-tyrosine phosphatase